MHPVLLSPSEIKAHLNHLPGWELHENCLQKSFMFKNFSAAFAFMTRVAMAAEKLNHHPDWKNSYRKVFISLHTHDLNGLSHLDMDLATEIETILQHELR